MVKQNFPLAEVVRYVLEQGEGDESDEHALMVMLSEYRGSLPSAEIAARVVPQRFLKKVSEFGEGIDELTELETLAEIQSLRVEYFVDKEKKLGFPMPMRGMAHEVEVLKDILVDSAKLKIVLGMDKRKRASIEAQASLVEEAEARHGMIEARVLGDKDSRRKLMCLVDRIRSKGIVEMKDVIEGEAENVG